MSLFDSLVLEFGYNEPILTNEITYKNYSKPWIYKEMSKLCRSGRIVHFDKGVYYIPTQTALGTSRLNPLRVVEKKYIKYKENTFGYVSGLALLNSMGVSTQVPANIEIYTNNETATVRDIQVGSQKVTLRKSRTIINSDNVAVLRFLEMMNTVSPAFFDDDNKAIIKEYISSNNISRQSITKYAPVFPDKVMRNLIESEVIYDVAQ